MLGGRFAAEHGSELKVARGNICEGCVFGEDAIFEIICRFGHETLDTLVPDCIVRLGSSSGDIVSIAVDSTNPAGESLNTRYLFITGGSFTVDGNAFTEECPVLYRLDTLSNGDFGGNSPVFVETSEETGNSAVFTDEETGDLIRPTCLCYFKDNRWRA